MLKTNIEEFDELLREQPDIVNSLRGEYGITLLMEGAGNKDTKIVSLLSKRGHDLSIVNDKHGRNVLHRIVLNNDDVSLELLNSLDATQLSSDVINLQNNFDDTPLHYAAWRNMHKSIVWLLNHGADPSLKNNRGECPDKHDDCDDKTKRLFQSFQGQVSGIFSFIFILD